MSEKDAPPPNAGRAAPATAGDDHELRRAETASAHPALPGARPPAAAELPQRIRPLPSPSMQSRTGPPPVSIEILQRVIDGLNLL
jgi:hypothetical protein